MKSGPRSPQLEKALAQKQRPNTAINKIKFKKQKNKKNKKTKTLKKKKNIRVEGPIKKINIQMFTIG